MAHFDATKKHGIKESWYNSSISFCP